MSFLLLFTGTDEQAIIELLGNRSSNQRVAFLRFYKTSYGKVTVLFKCNVKFICGHYKDPLFSFS